MQTLTTTQQADAMIDGERAVWLFKASSTCPISTSAESAVRQYMQQHPDEAVGCVVVQNHRPVSNHIAERLGITHQTPQIILVQQGRVIWHASHFKVTVEAMTDGRRKAGGDS